MARPYRNRRASVLRTAQILYDRLGFEAAEQRAAAGIKHMGGFWAAVHSEVINLHCRINGIPKPTYVPPPRPDPTTDLPGV